MTSGPTGVISGGFGVDACDDAVDVVWLQAVLPGEDVDHPVFARLKIDGGGAVVLKGVVRAGDACNTLAIE